MITFTLHLYCCSRNVYVDLLLKGSACYLFFSFCSHGIADVQKFLLIFRIASCTFLNLQFCNIRLVRFQTCTYDALIFKLKNQGDQKAVSSWTSFYLTLWLGRFWCSHYFMTGAYLQELSLYSQSYKHSCYETIKLNNLLVTSCRVTDTVDLSTIIYELSSVFAVL